MSADKATELLKKLVLAVETATEARNDAAVLIPEEDTEWPPGYDFAELERAQDLDRKAEVELQGVLKQAKKLLGMPT